VKKVVIGWRQVRFISCGDGPCVSLSCVSITGGASGGRAGLPALIAGPANVFELFSGQYLWEVFNLTLSFR
jgi:hypothetical protein